MKTYVLTVSVVFPGAHKRKGEETYFIPKILSNFAMNEMSLYWEPKIHTIRTNYPLWEKRIKEVQEGKAILSIRYWSGKPYNSKQVEICQLDKDSGVGVQMLGFWSNDLNYPWINNKDVAPGGLLDQLFKNDGLRYNDFKEWFKNYDLTEPMAIIHFTKFRY